MTRSPVLCATAAFLCGTLCANDCAYGSPDAVVVFNEVHYNPLGTDESGEWIELFNQMGIKTDISGWRLARGIDYTFPQGTIIDPGDYLVISKSPVGGQLGPFTGNLANAGERIALINQGDRLMDELDYGDSGRWPVAADGSGITLAKRKPYTAGKPPENWAASAQVGGTPGTVNFPDLDAPPPITTVPLFGLGSNWRYNESDIALPSDWATTAHVVGNDGWMEGPDPIGSESNITTPIATMLQFPGFRNPFVITYYFEREFELSAAQVGALQSLQLRHLIDDGAVFYLNGVEVFRINMPGGPVDPETSAVAGIEVDVLSPSIAIPAGAAVAGTNRLSVEVHQNNVNSRSDIVFGAELDVVLEGAVPGAGPQLFINEIPPASTDDGPFWIELVNEGPTPIDLEALVISVDGDPQREFVHPAGMLNSGEAVQLFETQWGFRPADGEKIFLYDATRTSVIDAQVVTESLRGRSAARGGAWLYPSVPTPGEAANTFEFNDDIVISEIAYNPPALPESPASFDTTTLVDFGDIWRYNDADEDLPSDWATSAHPLGGNWIAGATVIGRESSPLQEPIATQLANYTSSTVTYYFETEFDLTPQQLGNLDSLEITHQIDDGAVFYLNGVEVQRFNMDPGAVGPETQADSVGNAEIRSFVLNSPPLAVGSNRISVEVHQSSTGSSDLVFGARLDARVALSPYMPFRNSSNQWIELANKGTGPVDLGGWEFNDGVQFVFPAGTMLASGEHACVVRDAAEFAAAFPNARILGEFGGGLSRNGERLSLRDANKNPVDVLRYFDSGRWPDVADGGGASLELRDLRSDNNHPDSWATSDESGQTAWKSYSYRGTATGTGGPDGQWSEFNIGMLDAGELLIDDLSVVEFPDGAATQKLANTDFSSGASGWRFRGTHRHSEVIDDPDQPGNKVLRLIATSATGHMHNQVETTLLSPISSSREYEISFRARWVGGSNQLHTRLYFNRLARVNVIDRPEHVGTPGAPNSNGVANMGPTITNFIHSPAVPDAGQSVKVTARASDPDGVTGLTLFYSINGGAFQSTPMGPGAGSLSEGTIPGQSAATVVQFYVEATDGSGATAAFPPKGPESRALYKVNDGLAATNGQHNFRIVITNEERDFIHQGIEVMSNDRVGVTIIDREEDIYYDVGMRLKGSQHARIFDARVGYNFRFGRDNLYRGIHGSMAIDRSEGVGTGQLEILFDFMIANSGGIVSRYYDFIKVMAPKNQHTRSAVLQMARYDDVFLESQFGADGDGNLYEYELIYATNSQDGNGYKIGEPGTITPSSVSDKGDDEERYRWFFLKKNNREADDFGPIIEYNKKMGQSGAAFDDGLEEVVDVDAWLRGMAYAVLSGAGDNAGAGSAHNGMYYARPDGRVMFLPHDMDFAFSASRTIYANGECAKLTGDPVRRRIYLGHLHDIITTTWNNGYMSMWTSHLASFDSGQNWGGHLNYITSRSNNVLTQLRSASSGIPEVPFQITSPDPLTVDSSTATISGGGWVNVRAIRLAGSAEALEVTWTDGNSWQVTVPVVPGPNTVMLEALDFSGNVLDTETIMVTNTSLIEPASAANTIISEIHYHPTSPTQDEINAGFDDQDLFEFLELRNIGANTVDYTGVRFVEGVDFDFPNGLQLAPGEHTVVVRSSPAFQLRHPGVPVSTIAGEFVDSGLDNGGERLHLIAANGSTIVDFTYGDDHAWPDDADGNGTSLVFVAGDQSLAESWRNSAAAEGNPGASDSVVFVGDPGRDDDRDGLTALMEHFLGTSDGDSSSGPDASRLEILPSGTVEFTFSRNLGADDVVFSIEVSEDLAGWTPGTTVFRSESVNGDGTSTRVHELINPQGASYVRIRAQER